MNLKEFKDFAKETEHVDVFANKYVAVFKASSEHMFISNEMGFLTSPDELYKPSSSKDMEENLKDYLEAPLLSVLDTWRDRDSKYIEFVLDI